MKNLTKIFMAVSVALFAFACAADPTEDLGVNGVNQTEISLSLEGPRTHINGQVGEAYPLYWSEGDKISVNGVESEPLSKEQAGKSAATFIVSGNHTTYNIAYPAAPANQVLFAAEQEHVGNTSFGSGVTTLYGVGSKEEGATLHHLTGVLKFGVTGSAILKKAQISTIDRAPIAGAFDIDFATGEVTPSKNAVSTINYSFGEGVQLSKTATELHVVVPAGVYDELYVTLYDNEDGVMYAKVKADDSKPLTAGNIRTFDNNIAFSPINSGLHIISDADDLLAFASKAATSTKDVVFVADIDMSEAEWTPIEGYAGTINGNGYAIKGLKAPLFGATNAKIKGLHLKNVNQVWTTLAHGGLFACDLNDGGLLSHCSAEGEVVVNNTTYNQTKVDAWTDIVYGGLVGMAKSSVIEHCTNDADMKMKSVVAFSAIANFGLSWGGIVGAVALGESNEKGSITNVVNKGDLCYDNANTPNDKPLCNLYIYWGGIIGYNASEYPLSALNNLTNRGKLYSSEEAVRLASIRMGGIYGNLDKIVDGDCYNWYNHGAIELTGYGTGNPCISGIGRTINMGTGKAYNIVNKGDITLNVGYGNTYCSGTMLGMTNEGVSNMVNEGNIEVNDYSAEKGITGTLIVTGWGNNINPAIIGSEGVFCGNKGNITVNTTTTGATTIAGIGSTLHKSSAYLTNTGNISVAGTYTSTVTVSGIAGTISESSNNITNSGSVSFSGTANADAYVSGIGSTISAALTDVTNSGSVSFSGTATKAAYLSGIGSTISAALTDVTNSGSVSFSGTATTAAYLSGIGSTISAALTDVTNSGKISSTGTHNGDLYVSGITSLKFTGGAMTRVNNSGDLDLNGTFKTALRVAGLWTSNVSYADSTIYTNCHNSGYISIIDSYTATDNYVLHVGGLMGYSNKPVTFDGCSNRGKVVNGVKKGIYIERNTYSGICSFGGILGYVKTNITIRNGLTNSADIHSKVNNKYNGASGRYPIGGIFAHCTADCKVFDWEGTIKNSGTITYNGSAGEKVILGVGGVIGISETATACDINLMNTGDIVIKNNEGNVFNSPSFSTKHGFGGIVGYTTGKYNNARCFCNIEAINVTANIGFITGTPYSDAIKSTNCHIGGNIATTLNATQDGPAWTGLDDFNYVEYIYGTEILSGDAFANKCGWLKEDINSTPVGENEEPIQ